MSSLSNIRLDFRYAAAAYTKFRPTYLLSNLYLCKLLKVNTSFTNIEERKREKGNIQSPPLTSTITSQNRTEEVSESSLDWLDH